ncbi:MAG TPA: V-type ATPase subunit [Nitrospira sp.]|nr:V-type ATPase subunit [Nitrospira sp.]
MTDYAYSNARIRAMEGRLLGRSQYESLLDQVSFEGLIEVLKRLPYARALEHALTGYDPAQLTGTIVRIDEALRRDLAQNLGVLRRFFADRSRALIDTLFLRWDVYNLKTVLRGKRAAAPIEDIVSATFPVGILDDLAVAELARVPTLPAVAHLLETWRLPLARPVRTGLDRPGETDRLDLLETELDRFAVVHASRWIADGDDNDRTVLGYLRFLVDKTNLLTAFRYLAERRALSPIEAGRQFLKARGRFSQSDYEAVVGARDLREGLARLAVTPYAWLADAFAGRDTIALPLVERQLDRAAIRKTVGLSRPDPLGIGPAISYIERKTNEVRNLRMILRGKAVGMQNDHIEEWLILWPL